MKISPRRIAALSAVVAAAFLSGCVAVPADPYYGGYDYGYPTATTGYVGYGAYYGGPPVVVAPPLSIGISGVFGGHGHRGGPGWRGHGGGGHPGWRGHGGGPRWGAHRGGGHRGGFGGGRGGGGRGGGRH